MTEFKTNVYSDGIVHYGFRNPERLGPGIDRVLKNQLQRQKHNSDAEMEMLEKYKKRA